MTEMNTMNNKLAKIKKSSRVGKIVSNIFTIIGIVGVVITLIAGIFILNMGKRFDDEMHSAVEHGYIEAETDSIAHTSFMNINIGNPENIQTDVPALREALDDHPLSIMYGIYLLTISFLCVIFTVVMKIISGTFALIEKEENPFTDKVIKRVLIAMIVLSAVLLFTVGSGFAVLGALTTWVIYTVMDYGKSLQVQSDETL